MWIWIAIGVIVIFLMIFFKFKEIRHKFGLVVIALILIFFLLTFSSIYMKHKSELNTFDGVVGVGKIYFAWLGGVFGNVGKVTGYAVHQDWGLNTSDDSSSSNEKDAEPPLPQLETNASLENNSVSNESTK